MTDLKIYSVTLVFSPPGPVWASLVIARDEATASAIATHHVMTNEPLVTAPLLTVMALPVDPDMLRGMLRTIEGKGPGEVVSLVPKHVHVENDTAGQEYGPPLHTAPYEAIQAQRAARLQREREDDAYWAEQRAAEILRKHEPAPKADPLDDVLRLERTTDLGRRAAEILREPSKWTLGEAQQRAAEILRKHEPALDAADASTFCGSGATGAWEKYRAEHPDVYIGHRARENRQPPLHYWGEEYGPPMPEVS